jgi:ABC-type transporter Mla MlaB component
MTTNAIAWQLDKETLILRGIWLREQVASILPLLPKTNIKCIDMHAVEQVDSSLMTILLSIRAQQSEQVYLCGVSEQVNALLILYRLSEFFIQKGTKNCV